MYRIPEIPVPPMIPLEELAAKEKIEEAVGKTIGEKVWYLEEISGPHGNVALPCDREVILGRSARNCNMVFPEDTRGVSKVHCEVAPTPDGLLLKDLNSTYGTYLADGTRLQAGKPVLLKKGDRFYLSSPNIMFKVR